MRTVHKISTEDILMCLPIKDGHFLYELSCATSKEINNTINLLQRKRRTKTRVAVCQRELKKRAKARE